MLRIRALVNESLPISKILRLTQTKLIGAN